MNDMSGLKKVPLAQMSLTLIIGPMFAGKSSAILQKVRRAEILGWKHLVLTNRIDVRYEASGTQIVTHDHAGMDACGIIKLEEVFGTDRYSEAKLVVIEEAQFFTDLYTFVLKAVEEDGKEVVVVGLDGDSDRKPFGQILEVLPLADEVIRLSALCKRCGDGRPALFSALVRGVKQGQVHVGGADMYEPMCRKHYLENKNRT
jgi:thymidine kinase